MIITVPRSGGPPPYPHPSLSHPQKRSSPCCVTLWPQATPCGAIAPTRVYVIGTVGTQRVTADELAINRIFCEGEQPAEQGVHSNLGFLFYIFSR